MFNCMYSRTLAQSRFAFDRLAMPPKGSGKRSKRQQTDELKPVTGPMDGFLKVKEEVQLPKTPQATSAATAVLAAALPADPETPAAKARKTTVLAAALPADPKTRKTKLQPEEADSTAANIDIIRKESVAKNADRARQWAQFLRSLPEKDAQGNVLPPSARARTEKCPPEIARQMVDTDTQKLWFARYVDSNCSWARCQMREFAQDVQEDEDESSFAWLIRAQVQDLYKDAAVGDAVFQNALTKKSKWRRHPEVPWLDAAIQAKVFLSETHKERLKHMLVKEVSFDADLHAQDATQLMSQIAPEIDNRHRPTTEAVDIGNEPGEPHESEKERKEREQREHKASLAKEREEQRLQDKKQREEKRRLEQEARRRAAEIRKQEADAEKNGPRGKAKAWLAGVAGKIEQLLSLKQKAGDVADIDVGAMYIKKFDQHIDKLRKIREVLGGLDIEAHCHASQLCV